MTWSPPPPPTATTEGNKKKLLVGRWSLIGSQYVGKWLRVLESRRYRGVVAIRRWPLRGIPVLIVFLRKYKFDPIDLLLWMNFIVRINDKVK